MPPTLHVEVEAGLVQKVQRLGRGAVPVLLRGGLVHRAHRCKIGAGKHGVDIGAALGQVDRVHGLGRNHRLFLVRQAERAQVAKHGAAADDHTRPRSLRQPDLQLVQCVVVPRGLCDVCERPQFGFVVRLQLARAAAQLGLVLGAAK